MSKTTTAPEFITPNRSHFLQEPSYRSVQAGLPCDKEELHPIIRVTIPRAGTVRAEFSADRYAYTDSSGNAARLGDWRIVLRDVRTNDDETYGALAPGIGPAARATISELCEPLIRDYLESAEYRDSLKHAAAYMVRRKIIENGTTEYGLKGSRELLDRMSPHLHAGDFERMREAVAALEKAGEALDKIGKD
jgi:hypothetical protein